MKINISKKGWLAITLVVFAIASFGIVLKVSAPKGDNLFEDKKEVVVEKVEPVPVDSPIPESFLITMPYTPQAPNANWAVHEESCEEAAILMAHYLLASKLNLKVNTVIPPNTAHTELVAQKNWQVKNWGPERDLNMYDLGKLAKEYYGYNYKVTEDITEKEIKSEIAKGNPVLVPVITHGLANPHYGRQPSYHILVIKGYDATGIISNDAGIREGEGYRYTWEILWKAIDAQRAQMKQGRDMLVITK
jgi:hypothetical protein